MNMEPENTPLEKENLSKPSFSGSMLIFGGVSFFRVFFFPPISFGCPWQPCRPRYLNDQPIRCETRNFEDARRWFLQGGKLKGRDGDHF